MYVKDKPSAWSKLTTLPDMWLCINLNPSCRFHTLSQATVTGMALHPRLIKVNDQVWTFRPSCEILSLRRLHFFPFLLRHRKDNGEEGRQCNRTTSWSVPETDWWVLIYPLIHLLTNSQLVSKLILFGLGTKQDTWSRHLEPWETVADLFHHFLTFYKPNINQLIDKILYRWTDNQTLLAAALKITHLWG